MTYSSPNYFEIAGVDSKLAEKYKLYIYRDGYRDDNSVSCNNCQIYIYHIIITSRVFKLYGVPALFIPGQAGSYGQIRSLASTTTNLYHQNADQQKNIDFFTVDLNEELSALSGQSLLEQANYLNAVIERILQLYDEPRPRSVMIIGHSMGGVVARAMFMLHNYIPHSIDTIVTISTPHLTAPLLLDPIIYKTYKEITQFWKQNENTLLKDVILISIAGGSLDNIVHSDGIDIDSSVLNGLTTYTTSIPNVWTGCDHMAILWCRQFIQLLSSTLLEVVKADTPADRMNIFRYNLLDGTTIGEQSTLVDLNTITDKHFEPSILLAFAKESTRPSLAFMDASKKIQFLTNIQPEFDSRWSAVLCQENFNCDYVKPNVTLLPSATAENLIGSNPYRLLEIEREVNFKYVGVIDHGGDGILDGDNQVFLTGQAISDKPVVHTSSIFDIGLRGLHFHVDSFNTTHVFPFIKNTLFAFDVHVESINGQERLFKPFMQQAINNREIVYHRGLEQGISDRITFHQDLDKNHQGLSLRFFMDEQTLDIQLSIDWYGTVGRCVLRYGSIMVLFFWVISLVVLLSQLYSYAINGKREFSRFEIALFNCLKGPILQIAALLLVATSIQLYAASPFASKNIFFGSDDWTMAGLLLFMFVLSIGLTFVIWLAVSLMVNIISLPVGVFPVRIKTAGPFAVHLTIVAGCLGFIPPSVLFCLYFIVWTFMTASSRVSARSDLPTVQNVYNYRLSWLVFLTSLLPYYVPSVIVFVKDIMIGWTQYSVLPIKLAHDIPGLLVVIYLVTFGKNPDVLETK
ncbi:PGAP1-like protein-domain-containing protein [Mucor mucedo]|uniref:PGAP1-like protein-domain-containing protein n=1 Tax=Mucor mucedo TaxID=29922 RepID=UPI00222044EB|nr:PGAP1-like protein-domain-containing protein [Mucor mucedo]KAI7878366.1 PGAP1-like protein-domain-containing protein [Mucor mucedo]